MVKKRAKKKVDKGKAKEEEEAASVDTMVSGCHWRRTRQKRRPSLLFGGRNSFNSMPNQDDLKKSMNGRFEKWVLQKIGWSGSITPSHHPPKMDVLLKNLLQIILAAKWLPQTAATTFVFSSMVAQFQQRIKMIIESKKLLALAFLKQKQNKTWILYFICW